MNESIHINLQNIKNMETLNEKDLVYTELEDRLEMAELANADVVRCGGFKENKM